jgi:hypothetical protein
MMDKVRKPNISVCYTPSSEPYSIYSFDLVFVFCENNAGYAIFSHPNTAYMHRTSEFMKSKHLCGLVFHSYKRGGGTAQ